MQTDSAEPMENGKRGSLLSLIRQRPLLPPLFAILLVWIVYINLPGRTLEVTEFQSTGTMIAAAEKSEPFQARVVYSPGYLISIGGLEKLHPFDIRKYEKIHNKLVSDGLLTDEQTYKPEPIDRDDLALVHTSEYLDSLKSRKKIAEYLEAGILLLAPVSLDRAVLAPFRRASGGTLLAGRLALEHGIGINLGGGYHHAKPDKGEGFCAYADVAIAIRRLQNENLIERAIVIDVDAHQGNGTAECLANDDSTLTFSMHQGDIYPYDKSESDLDIALNRGTDDAEFMRILERYLDKVLDESKADICFIVAGCDTLATDPLAHLEMTPEGVVRRDSRIVEACVARRIPVVVTLSGGYSPKAWETQYKSVRNLLESYPAQ